MILTRNTEPIYWTENKNWYIKDKNAKYGVRIKDDAPDRAKKSFQMWFDLQENDKTT